MEAKIYKESGRVARVFPQNGTDFTLRELQGIVGGYIELVHLGNGNVMVINEEAKGKIGTTINVSATRIAREHQVIFAHDCIVGNALVCPSEMIR